MTLTFVRAAKERAPAPNGRGSQAGIFPVDRRRANGRYCLQGAAMRDYEFRIFSAKGGVSLIVHSCHLTDSAAIRSARAFAGAAPFEVWRDLERLLPKPAPARATVRLEQDGQTRLYEFKLSSPRQSLCFSRPPLRPTTRPWNMRGAC